MADTKTSDEAAATALTGAELVRVVQSATSKKTTAALLGHHFRGARVRMTADDTAQNATGTLTITFDQAQFDTDSFWSAGSPTRLTIPAGVTYVELTGQVYITLSNPDTAASAYITHFNSSSVAQRAVGFRFIEHGGAGNSALVPTTGPIAVTAGDYFTLVILEESDNSITIEGDNVFETFLSLKVLGMAP
jgi:hypothetical protein